MRSGTDGHYASLSPVVPGLMISVERSAMVSGAFCTRLSRTAMARGESPKGM